ncbi:MAG: stage II sporulation protein M [Oscillospiraceae bacterium]|nr:stage II sporulation protein M [Oscillospiraceae bacterium]
MTKVISLRKKRGYATNAHLKKRQTGGKKVNINGLQAEKYKVIFAFLSIVAVLCGSLIYKNYPNDTVNTIIAEKLNFLQSESYIQILLYFIKLDIIFISISFFAGTSFMGSSISFLPPFLKCVLIGYIGSYFYNEFELKGVLFCLLLLYPYFIITTASLIFASNESVYMSTYIFKTITNKNTADNISVRLYLLRYLILIIINTVCAAVNSGLILFLAPKISLR